MEKRDLLKVGLLSIFTLGIYTVYWFVMTARELRLKGVIIPTSWLLLVPLANIWWTYKYYVAAEKVTNGGVSALMYFLLGLFVTSIIPMLLAQNEYNAMANSSKVNDNS